MWDNWREGEASASGEMDSVDTNPQTIRCGPGEPLSLSACGHILRRPKEMGCKDCAAGPEDRSVGAGTDGHGCNTLIIRQNFRRYRVMGKLGKGDSKCDRPKPKRTLVNPNLRANGERYDLLTPACAAAPARAKQA